MTLLFELQKELIESANKLFEYKLYTRVPLSVNYPFLQLNNINLKRTLICPNVYEFSATISGYNNDSSNKIITDLGFEIIENCEKIFLKQFQIINRFIGKLEIVPLKEELFKASVNFKLQIIYEE